MKRIFLALTIIFTSALIISTTWYLTKYGRDKKSQISSNRKIPGKLGSELEIKASNLKAYAHTHLCNDRVGFLVDMSIESGKRRFFVYDLENDSLMAAGLVAHGSCNENWLSGRKYGNELGCGCTSLGRYKIGNPYNGKFGHAYRLYGLDSANSNALKRSVVLHSFYAVPDEEVFPYPICQSLGCPMVSPAFLKRLQLIIDNSEKPILLWIYE